MLFSFLWKMKFYYLKHNFAVRWFIYWLFIVLCPAQGFSLPFTGEGLCNLDICSVLRAFEQGKIFLVPHLLWHGTSIVPVFWRAVPFDCHFQHERGSRGPIIILPVLFNCLFRHIMGCIEHIQTIILTGPLRRHSTYHGKYRRIEINVLMVACYMHTNYFDYFSEGGWSQDTGLQFVQSLYLLFNGLWNLHWS
jgi:hypothetical protein